MAESAVQVVKYGRGKIVLGLGKYFNAALDKAAKNEYGTGTPIAGVSRTYTYRSSRVPQDASSSSPSASSFASDTSTGRFPANGEVTITHLQHPTAMSPYVSTNLGALNSATYYDTIFQSERISFPGIVIMNGLQSDGRDKYRDGPFRVAINDRAIEKLSRKATKFPHTNVIAHAKSLGIDNDDEAAEYLSENHRGHLPLPLLLHKKSTRGMEGSRVGMRGRREAE